MDEFEDTHNPIPIIISILADIGVSDLLVKITEQCGVSFDLQLTKKEDFSNRTRIRTYLKRITNVLKTTENDKALRTISLITKMLIQEFPDRNQEIVNKLESIGWEYTDNGLLPKDEKVVELYFEKGSVHSAYVMIKEIIASTKNELIIVDPYISTDTFNILKSLDNNGTYSIILIYDFSRAKGDIEYERSLFEKEYPHLKIRLFDTKDVHDRFVILDHKRVFNIGASIKDAGSKAFMMKEIETLSVKNKIIEDISNIFN